MPIADEALIAELRNGPHYIDTDEGFMKLAADRIAALTAEVESLRADARRYRFLRDHEEVRPRDIFDTWWLMEQPGDLLNAPLDAAIDHALAQGAEQGLT